LVLAGHRTGHKKFHTTTQRRNVKNAWARGCNHCHADSVRGVAVAWCEIKMFKGHLGIPSLLAALSIKSTIGENKEPRFHNSLFNRNFLCIFVENFTKWQRN